MSSRTTRSSRTQSVSYSEDTHLNKIVRKAKSVVSSTSSSTASHSYRTRTRNSIYSIASQGAVNQEEEPQHHLKKKRRTFPSQWGTTIVAAAAFSTSSTNQSVPASENVPNAAKPKYSRSTRSSYRSKGYSTVNKSRYASSSINQEISDIQYLSLPLHYSVRYIRHEELLNFYLEQLT